MDFSDIAFNFHLISPPDSVPALQLCSQELCHSLLQAANMDRKIEVK